MTRTRRLLTVSCLAAVALPGVALAGSPGQTYSKARTGGQGQNATNQAWYSDEASLDPVAIAANGMKVAWKAKLSGQIYGQPIKVGTRVIAVTENNHVASMDVKTGKVQWDTALPKPWDVTTLKQQSGQSCPDLTPNVGVTSTPVLDPSGQVLYVVDKQADTRNPRLAHFVLHAIRVSTGKDAWTREIGGAADNIRGAVFNPTTSNQRAGLLFLDGRVYMTFAGHCDIGPYRGWVVGVDARSHRITSMWTAASQNGIEADSSGGNGIWMGGGAIASDGPGRLYVTTGNGPTPPSGTDVDPTQVKDFGDSVIRLQVGSNGKLTAKDFFAPKIADKLNVSDSDLGSSGITLLPDSFGTPQHPHVGILYDKESRVFLVDRDDLGKRGTRTDTNLQSLGPYTYGAKGQLAAFGNDGGWVYYADSAGLRAFRPSSKTIDGAPSLEFAGISGPEAHIGVAPGQGSPVITSDGGRDGTGVVWVVGRDPHAGRNGHLMAFQTQPVNGRLKMIYRGPEFQGTKFARPLPDDGKIIVGQYDGGVTAYTVAKPGSGPNFRDTHVDLGSTPIGVPTTQRVDLLPRRGKGGGIRSLTVKGTGFSVKRVTGDILDITFSPTKVGNAQGTITVITLNGPETVPLSAVGEAAGTPPVAISPATLTLPDTVVGEFVDGQLQVDNDTATAVPVLSVAVAAPFTTPGVSAGITIPAHGSLIIPITFSPTAQAAATSPVTLVTGAGTLTATVAANGTGPGIMTLSSTAITFPATKVGRTSTATLTVTNTGPGVIHLDKAKEPTGDFKDKAPIFEGATIQPGQRLVQHITFTPTAKGTRRSAYTLTADDNQGVRTITLTGQGT